MITSLSDDIGFINKRGALQDYQIVYTKLNDFIDKVNLKIVSRIQLVQQVYLDDYKQQVSIMGAELKAIRGVLDEQLLKQRSNQRLFYLEQQRDFFRAQVIKLNQQLKKAGEENNKLKTELSETKQQCGNFKKIVYDLETRIYKLTYENIQIQKMKQETKNLQTTTMNSTTPLKGMITQRQKKIKYESEIASSQGDGQSQTNSQAGLQRQKTQYSLRKIKPSFSFGATTPNLQFLAKNVQATTREQILDRCIKEVKKQIFYRNLNPKEQNKINFDEDEKVQFQKFTKSDKKQLVYRFMSNPEILQEFYKFIFQKQITKNFKETTSKSGALDKIALSKGIDPRYNTKMLDSFKAEFDKKIYDIKANRY